MFSFIHYVTRRAQHRSQETRTYRSRGAAAQSAAAQPRKLTTSSASDRRLCASTAWTPVPWSKTRRNCTHRNEKEKKRKEKKTNKSHNPLRSRRVIPQKGMEQVVEKAAVDLLPFTSVRACVFCRCAKKEEKKGHIFLQESEDECQFFLNLNLELHQCTCRGTSCKLLTRRRF